MTKGQKTGLIVAIGLVAGYFLLKKKTPSSTIVPTGTKTTPATSTTGLLSQLVSSLTKSNTPSGSSSKPSGGTQGGGGGGGSAPASNRTTPSGVDAGQWTSNSDGTTTRTNSDGSVDTNLAGGYYKETDKNGDVTVYDSSGNVVNNATVNEDGSVSIPDANGFYTNLDPQGGSTVLDDAGNEYTVAQNPDGSTQYIAADGSYTEVDTNGDVTDYSADGTALGSVYGPFRRVQSELVNFSQVSPTPSSILSPSQYNAYKAAGGMGYTC